MASQVFQATAESIHELIPRIIDIRGLGVSSGWNTECGRQGTRDQRGEGILLLLLSSVYTFKATKKRLKSKGVVFYVKLNVTC